jgi:O-antigen/teichoic acid export membrane protein/cell division septum initiation protein DivIVA
LSGLVGRVARASALAQVFGELVTFVQTIALARLLTPRDVGIFIAGTVLTGLFTTFVEGGLRSGLVQRQGDLADADETVFWVTLMVGVAASLGCLAAAPVIGIIFNSRTAGLVAAATSGVLLIHSLTNVPESVLQREFSVKRRLIVGPAISVSYAVVAVSLAALGWGVWSMVAGTYAFYITWVVSLWMITSWRPGRGHASFAMWRELARFGFPIVVATTGWRVRTAVEALVVGRFLSATALGFFRYGQRIAQIPIVGIVEVGATTLFPAFSRIANDRERLAAAYLRALHWSMVGAAAGTGLMIAAGEPAVVVLFGERWRGAGVALVAMSGLSIASAVIVVVQDVIKARGRTRLINWFALADLFLGVGFLLVLIGPFGFVGASLYVSLTALSDAAVLLALAQLVVTVPFRRVLTVLATPVPGLLVATTATWLLEHDLLRADSRGPILGVVLLAVDALVFCLLYLAVLTVFARPTVVTIVRIVPVLISRFRRGAPADTTTSPRIEPGDASGEPPARVFDVVLRGYDRYQVEEHVRQLEDQARRARDEVEVLRRNLDDARGQLEEGERTAYVGLGSRTEQLLRLAEEQATEILAEARTDAGQLRAAAEQEVARLRTDAEREAAQLKVSAEQEQEEILTPARRQAEEMRGQAQRILEESQAQRAQAEAEFEARLASRHEEAERQEAARLAAARAATQKLVTEAEQRAGTAQQRGAKASAQAEQTRREADQHAGQLVSGAQNNADRITAEAKTQADRLLANTGNEVERIRAATQRKLAELTAQRESIAGQLQQLRQLLGTQLAPAGEPPAEPTQAAGGGGSR